MNSKFLGLMLSVLLLSGTIVIADNGTRPSPPPEETYGTTQQKVERYQPPSGNEDYKKESSKTEKTTAKSKHVAKGKRASKR